eukprot:TRINITY_DN11971_c0_g1_i1.p1 TRINITY_DN11971_c0_g1~~TRINITY_DN11971_c0_g1_i1.p1  ORF type:complete len:104 (-),score=1.73 TRINITY_DN11971_c0_g1_i1:459-770(-)
MNLSAIYFLKSSVANCFSQGAPSGIVLDSGNNFTNISRVVDGYQEDSYTINLGGNCITHELNKIIEKKDLTNSLTYPSFDSQNPLRQISKSREFKDIKSQLFR